MDNMRYVFLVICVSMSYLGYSQKLKLGFRGGPNFSNFYGHYLQGEIPNHSLQTGTPNNPPVIVTPGTNYSTPKYYYKTDFIKDMRVGFFSYLFLDIQLKDRLSLECGLGYSQKGIDMEYSQHSTSINSGNTEVTEQSYYFNRNLRLDYIAVPAIFKYEIDRKHRFHILGGIYNSFAVNFLIKNSVVTVREETHYSSGEFKMGSISNSFDNKSYAKIFDAGLVGGFAIKFPLTERMKIGLDIRSTIGVISIASKYEDYGFQSFSEIAKNINFETGLNLHYTLK